jgi:hypothetical protein
MGELSVSVMQDRLRVRAFWACASGRFRSHGQQPQRVLAYREPSHKTLCAGVYE